MMRIARTLGLAAVVSGIPMLGCDQPEKPPGEPLAGYNPAPGNWVPPVTEEEAERQDREFDIELKNAEGQRIDAEVTLAESDDGVRMVADLANMPPGKYGFRIGAEEGCRFEGSAREGSDEPAGPNQGRELGHIDVGPDGMGRFEVVIRGVDLETDGSESLIGRAMILHSVEETEKRAAHPTRVGVPIACAVIESD